LANLLDELSQFFLCYIALSITVELGHNENSLWCSKAQDFLTVKQQLLFTGGARKAHNGSGDLMMHGITQRYGDHIRNAAMIGQAIFNFCWVNIDAIVALI
jgi:hypothetical protein